MTSEGRRKVASGATSILIGSPSVEVEDRSKLDVRSIPIYKIKERTVNEFSETDVSGLAASIRLCGLINPLSVVHHGDTDEYVICSGHRRFHAIKRLHEEYPDDPDYQDVDCAVYEVTDDEFLLKQGLPYITSEQEESIYRDSNLENRQLSYSDVARQIRYLVNRFEDEQFVVKLRKHAAESGIVTRDGDFDKRKLIMSVLAESNYDGWNRETIRQYLKVKDAGREDLLDLIEENKMSVNKAYNQVILENNQKRERPTNKLPILKRHVAAFAKESETRQYSEDELSELRKIADTLEMILEMQQSKYDAVDR